MTKSDCLSVMKRACALLAVAALVAGCLAVAGCSDGEQKQGQEIGSTIVTKENIRGTWNVVGWQIDGGFLPSSSVKEQYGNVKVDLPPGLEEFSNMFLIFHSADTVHICVEEYVYALEVDCDIDDDGKMVFTGDYGNTVFMYGQLDGDALLLYFPGDEDMEMVMQAERYSSSTSLDGLPFQMREIGY